MPCKTGSPKSFLHSEGNIYSDRERGLRTWTFGYCTHMYKAKYKKIPWESIERRKGEKRLTWNQVGNCRKITGWFYRGSIFTRSQLDQCPCPGWPLALPCSSHPPHSQLALRGNSPSLALQLFPLCLASLKYRLTFSTQDQFYRCFRSSGEHFCLRVLINSLWLPIISNTPQYFYCNWETHSYPMHKDPKVFCL